MLPIIWKDSNDPDDNIWMPKHCYDARKLFPRGLILLLTENRNQVGSDKAVRQWLKHSEAVKLEGYPGLLVADVSPDLRCSPCDFIYLVAIVPCLDSSASKVLSPPGLLQGFQHLKVHSARPVSKYNVCSRATSSDCTSLVKAFSLAKFERKGRVNFISSSTLVFVSDCLSQHDVVACRCIVELEAEEIIRKGNKQQKLSPRHKLNTQGAIGNNEIMERHLQPLFNFHMVWQVACRLNPLFSTQLDASPKWAILRDCNLFCSLRYVRMRVRSRSSNKKVHHCTKFTFWPRD